MSNPLDILVPNEPVLYFEDISDEDEDRRALLLDLSLRQRLKRERDSQARRRMARKQEGDSSGSDVEIRPNGTMPPSPADDKAKEEGKVVKLVKLDQSEIGTFSLVCTLALNFLPKEWQQAALTFDLRALK
ncbi:hypothetical protein LTR62_005688 [Meristemomyces frigidus]|uniref:Uncharacterized protein n=1 Tax=Meristemomyces frigidus TaxID=1508187 RepID=A0AAN7TDW1_9PEZI|nr:hypothetical protein LTR62_005688 [Meristemomyces frigidus]